MAFYTSELFLPFQQSCGAPGQRPIFRSPTLYLARHPLHPATIQPNPEVIARY